LSTLKLVTSAWWDSSTVSFCFFIWLNPLSSPQVFCLSILSYSSLCFNQLPSVILLVFSWSFLSSSLLFYFPFLTFFLLFSVSALR
jgi:hypothetical protein